MLDILSKFVRENHLTVNTGKSKVMCLGRELEAGDVLFDEVILERV